MKVNRADFTLQKVKIHQGNLEVSKTENASTNGIVSHGSGSMTYTDDPHPDLIAAIKAMTPKLRDVYPFQEEFLDKITANGIAISGKGSNKGVIITGTYQTPSGRMTAANSDRLFFKGTAYGWEDQLQDLVTKIEDEVFEYLENGKRGQLEIAFDDDSQDDRMDQGPEETDHAGVTSPPVEIPEAIKPEFGETEPGVEIAQGIQIPDPENHPLTRAARGARRYA